MLGKTDAFMACSILGLNSVNDFRNAVIIVSLVKLYYNVSVLCRIFIIYNFSKIKTVTASCFTKSFS